jgi:hypothetical protein
VYLHIVMSDELPGTAFTALREEAGRIWGRHRIVLSWGSERPLKTDTRYAAVIPVIFDNREMVRLGRDDSEDLALAKAVFSGPTQTIYVSASRTLAMVSRLRAVGVELHGQGAREVRLGTFLGRVVAHELGHVFLTSLSHATHGLMRRTFVFQDLASGDDGSIELTTADAGRLAMRFSLVPRGPEGILATRAP